MKYCYLILLSLGLLALLGCQSKDLLIWIAKEKVEVNESPEVNKQVFTIEAGEVCVPGRQTLMKDYQYTEILCKKGYGWVIGSQRLFDVVYSPNTEIN